MSKRRKKMKVKEKKSNIRLILEIAAPIFTILSAILEMML